LKAYKVLLIKKIILLELSRLAIKNLGGGDNFDFKCGLQQSIKFAIKNGFFEAQSSGFRCSITFTRMRVLGGCVANAIYPQMNIWN
jgi:hypothetical protein